MSAARKLAREYELVYILRPTVTPAEARKVADRVNDVIGRLDAKLTKVDNWGKRKLAYTIKTSAGRFTRGIFVFVKYAGFDGAVAEIERNLRLLDDVLRFQTVRLDTQYELADLEVDPEEVEFKDIEATEDEADPTFEETLGMKPRPPRAPRSSEPSSDSDRDSSSDSDDDSSSDSDDSSSDSDSDDEDASAKKKTTTKKTESSSDEEE